MEFYLYSVGGHVRDGLIGIDSKDIDYTVVIKDRHLYEDPLRILRGLRFTVTKGFYFSDHILDTLRYFDARRMDIVSPERVRNELIGVFKYDTKVSLRALNSLRMLNSDLYDSLFRKELWFKPTFEKR